MKKNLVLMALSLAGSIMVWGCGKTDVQKEPASVVQIENTADEVASQDNGQAKSMTDDGTSDNSDTQTTSSIEDIFGEEVLNHTMTTDIEGCDTFTQIVDKLPEGAGYANVTIGDTDVLLVASGYYDNGDGTNAAIDSEVFYYKDGVPTYAGYITSGGTAYPLSVKDGILFEGGNHFMKKTTMEGGEFKNVEQAWVIYNEDGTGTYYYQEGNKEASISPDDSTMTRMYTESEGAEIIDFN